MEVLRSRSSYLTNKRNNGVLRPMKLASAGVAAQRVNKFSTRRSRNSP